MSVEERILRLENAVATLSEISAQHDERMRELANTSQRLESTTQRLASTTQELASMSQSLIHLAERASERADTQDGWINELGRAQGETDRKRAALVDAQVETEHKMGALIDAQMQTEQALGRLTERVDRLAQTVERHISGGHGG